MYTSQKLIKIEIEDFYGQILYQTQDNWGPNVCYVCFKASGPSGLFSQFSAPFHPTFLELGTGIGHTQLKVFYIDFY